MKYFLVAVAMIVSVHAHADKQPKGPAKPPIEAEKLQQLQQIDQTSAAIEALQRSGDAIAASRESKCMAAIGHQGFCRCLSDHLPANVDLAMYVLVTTNSKAEMDYEQLPPDDRKLIDSIMAVHDRCVAEAFPPHK